MRKAIGFWLAPLVLSIVSGQVFGQGSPYQITSQSDPRAGADLTTRSFGALNAPAPAGAPLSPLPVEIESDSFTGGLTARMHIAMPLARGRSVPDLVLAYHSQQSYGSVGVGWAFSAGSITRNKAGGIAYSSKDFRISLGSASVDLIHVQDDLYRDKQGDLRIEARYSPDNDSWTVFDSFGTKYAFGSARGSRLSGAGRTIQWSLDRVEDLSGNYSELTYRKGAGALNLSSLLFSGNSRSGLQPRNRLDITYEAQPLEATTTSFADGILANNIVRIRQIAVTAEGRQFATYYLKYRSSQETARSLLVAVIRKAGSLSSSIKFSYSDKVESNRWLQAQVAGPIRSATIYSQCLLGDFDGDGRADLACALDTSGQWQMGLSRGSSNRGDETKVKQQYDGFNVGVWAGPAVNKQIEVSIAGSSPNPLIMPDKKENIADVRGTCLAGDFNGDGRTDIACYNSSDGTWNVGLSNGHGFDLAVWHNGPALAGGAGGANPLTDRCVSGDFNGDGKTDIACLVSSAAVSDEAKWSMALSTGKGWNTNLWTGAGPTGASEPAGGACIAADFNGDRRQDVACYSATDRVWHVAISTGKGFRSSPWPNGPVITGDFGPPQAVVPSHCVVGDFNGDGNADIACYMGKSGPGEFNGKWSMGFSAGSGWRTEEWLGQPVLISKEVGWIVGNQCFAGDFNGDGRTDIACNNDSDLKYRRDYRNAAGGPPELRPWGQSLSSGSGFASSLFDPNPGVHGTNTALGLPYSSCVVADFTGDGKSDLLCDSLWQSNQYVLSISDFRPTDVMTEMTDSLGLTGHYSYGFSSYEKNTKLGLSLPVLKRSTNSDGHSSATTRYAYSGGAYFRAGNQFRGFRRTQIAHDVDADGRQLQETLWFHQGDGLKPDQGFATDKGGLTVGKLYRRTLKDRQTRPLMDTLLQYELEPTTVPNSRAPRLARQTTEISSSTGSVGETATLSYDDAGSISEIVVSSANDNRSIETHQHLTYSNDREAHAFGYLLSEELADNQFGKLRQVTYSYDTPACDTPALGAHLWQLTAVKRWIDADSSTEEKFSRSVSGNVTCYEDSLGERTVSVFDAQDEHISKITNPLNQSVTFSYYDMDTGAIGANAGRLSSITNGSGDTTKFFYDPFGRLGSVINPDVSSTKISYSDFGDPAKQLILRESSVGLMTKQFINGYGRGYSVIQSAPQGKAVGFSVSYDHNGQLIRMSAPTVMAALGDKIGRATAEYEVQRDELGRVLSLRDARGDVSRSCYDGLRVARLDANGNGWIDTFDVFGNRVSTEEYAQHFVDCNRVLKFHPPSSQFEPPNAITTVYVYDALRRLRAVTRQGKLLTSISYDGLGNVIFVRNVERGETRYSYDRSGRLSRWEPDSKRAIELKRDALGRVSEVFSVDQGGKHDSLNTFGYDRGDHAAGRLTQGNAAGVRTDLFYDAMGRIVRQVNSVDGHDYNLGLNYDSLGRIDSVEYPDGARVHNKYDGSMLSGVEWSNLKLVQLQEFNAYLEPTSLLFGNGVRETGTYGIADPQPPVANTPCESVPASYLCSISAAGGAESEGFKLLYHYDPIANVVGLDDATVGSANFSYDRFDRLIAETHPPSSGIPSVNYIYDPVGRRESVSGQGAYKYREDTGTAFSAPSQVGSTSISYDEEGRRQSYGQERYEYDALGRLAEVIVPAHNTTIRYSYDAFGNLISRKVDADYGSEATYFISRYAECVHVTSRAGVECRDLVYGPAGLVAGLRSGKDNSDLRGDPEYYDLDRDGTIKSIRNQAGATLARLSYSAFGTPVLTNTSDSRASPGISSLGQYFYAGHRWDPDSGLYYFGTRFYDPRIGQFVSPDADTIIASGGINTYTYARNNPNRWIDPDGRQDMGGFHPISTFTMGSNVGGGGLGALSGSVPSFSSVPNLSFGLGALGIGHGGVSFHVANVPAFSGNFPSLIRLTGPNETYIRYEVGNSNSSRIGPAGELAPNTFAAPSREGVLPQGELNVYYNLPRPEIAREALRRQARKSDLI